MFDYNEIIEQSSDLTDNLNVRYNSDTDMVQVKYNGAWLDWVSTGIQTPYALIPAMTSNIAPHGTVTDSTAYAGRPAYQAFNGSVPNLNDGSTFWSAATHAAGQWLAYQFESPVIIKKYQLYTGDTLTFKLQRYDGIQWIDVETRTANGNGGNSLVQNVYELETEITAYGIRIYVTSLTSIVAFAGVQAYGRKGVPV